MNKQLKVNLDFYDFKAQVQSMLKTARELDQDIDHKINRIKYK